MKITYQDTKVNCDRKSGPLTLTTYQLKHCVPWLFFMFREGYSTLTGSVPRLVFLARFASRKSSIGLAYTEEGFDQEHFLAPVAKFSSPHQFLSADKTVEPASRPPRSGLAKLQVFASHPACTTRSTERVPVLTFESLPLRNWLTKVCKTFVFCRCERGREFLRLQRQYSFPIFSSFE